MFLDTVNLSDCKMQRRATGALEAEPVYAPWLDFPFTSILHHQARCCHAAQAWLTGTDRAQLYGESVYTGPRWLRSRYDWGPVRHPLHWCEAVRLKKLDCGAQAALARAVLEHRGLTCLPLQVVQRYNAESAAHWHCAWEQKACDPGWISGAWIYHEGCALVLPDGSLKLWDSSDACWLERGSAQGYGSLVALKVSNPQATGTISRNWEGQSIPENQWVAVRALL